MLVIGGNIRRRLKRGDMEVVVVRVGRRRVMMDGEGN